MARGGAQGETLRVEGFRELVRAFALADVATKRELRETLRETGRAVQRDSARFVVTEHKKPERSDAKTAAGYRVYVRQRGVSVEQSLRRTTGLHPEWGGWQMRHALIPALHDNEAETNRRMEHALDVIAARFNEGGPSFHA